jgi:TonB family protein
VIRADDGGRIVKCQPLDPATAAETARTGCASLTARGVPATVAPARPKVLPRLWNDQRDLPDEDRRARRGGKVEMVFEVDEQGRIAGCNIYRSSGAAGVDRAACAGVLARARFSPATFKGQPTRAIGTMEYTFRP